MPKRYLRLCLHCCSRYLPFLTLKMLYGFASGTVACEATVSSRSLPLGTFSARDERVSGEKVPRGEE